MSTIKRYNSTTTQWERLLGAGYTDATTTSKGVVQLAGDLAGTAAAPTVPGLTTKEPTIAAGTTSQFWRGDKTWQAVPTPTTISGSITESQVTNLTTDLAAKQASLTLTTTGTSGAATLTGATLNIPTYAAGSGTVTNVSVITANGLAGTVATPTTTPAITLTTSVTGLVKGNGTALSAATSGTDYSAGTNALATGIIKSTTGTGALSIAVAADFPTLNQNTTGNAATVTTNANLTGDVTSVGNTTTYNNALPVAKGGTGATATTGTGSNVLSTSPTLVTPILGTPTSGTLTNATGLPLSTGVVGNLPVANLNAGTNASATTFWRGDGTWSTVYSVTGTTEDVQGYTYTTPRPNLRGTIAPASGALLLYGFTAGASRTISKLSVTVAGTAAAGVTMFRMGIYTVAANGGLTLVASTPNTTTGLAATYNPNFVALTTPYALVAGTRYMVGVVILATTMPILNAAAGSDDYGANSFINNVQQRLTGSAAGQTDLPATLADTAITNTGNSANILLII